jgi:signal transduction histidine kinase
MSLFTGIRLPRFARRSAVSADRVAVAAKLSERIETRQVEMLDSTVLSAAANVLAAVIIAVIVEKDVGRTPLAVWIFSLIAIVAALILRTRWHAWKAARGEPAVSPRQRLREHVFFSTSIGVAWSALCVLYGADLSAWHMLVLSLAMVGCTSGAIPALGIYLPAFYGFFAAALLPLAYANFVHPSPSASNVALLILLYIAAVAANARAYNRSVVAALWLRAKNEMLADSVAAAEAATSAAMKSKWESFAHLSHELRTPMNAVLGFSDMMRRQMFGALSPRYLDYAGHIHESGGHALALIDSILEVSQARTGRISLAETEIEPAALIAECLHMIEPDAAAKRLGIETDIAENLPPLHADGPKLRQVLLNLLANAVKYTPDGGVVAVAARRAEGGLDIEVRDTGIGIAPGDIERCQEPFIRLGDPLVSNVQGAGLGLPIAKHLVEAHGGRLAIESALGLGTKVTLHLPPERCGAGAHRLRVA